MCFLVSQVIPTDSFLQACEATVALLEQFGGGSSAAVAFRPVQSNLADLVQRIARAYKAKPNSLDFMVQSDVENKVTSKESSACYCALWITRTLEFLCAFLEDVAEGAATEQAAAKASATYLEPYQNFASRAAYQVAMRLVPAREKWLEHVAKHVIERDRESVVVSDIREFLVHVVPLVRSMHEFFVSNGLVLGRSVRGSSSS